MFHGLICGRILLNIRSAAACSDLVGDADQTSQANVARWSTRTRTIMFWRKKGDVDRTGDISLQTLRSSRLSGGGVP